MKLGDVLTMRGGTTVEVLNTDAEGRLVMADALVLAAEERLDAIVDIATLTGAAMRAFGTSDRRRSWATTEAWSTRSGRPRERTDEPVWQLPLERRYRPQLDSDDRRHQEHGRRQRRARSPPACSSRSSSDGTPVGAHRHRRHRP